MQTKSLTIHGFYFETRYTGVGKGWTLARRQGQGWVELHYTTRRAAELAAAKIADTLRWSKVER